MREKFNISGLVERYEGAIRDAQNVIGSHLVSVVSDNIRKNKLVLTGNLVNSISYSTSEHQSSPAAAGVKPISKPEKYTTRVGTTVIYAAIHEFGGTIVPDKAKALAVPVSPEAKKLSMLGKGPRDIPGLVMIAHEGRTPILALVNPDKTLNVMYALLNKVTIGAKPYLRPALQSEKNIIAQIFAKAVTKGVANGTHK
jgi:phage gpG-like protein